MSQRYFIRFSYDGTNYHGWQIQPNGLSVQEVMTKELQKLFGPELSLLAAGRTDTGVHARMMYAHFDLPEPVADVEALAKKLDMMMPADISVQEVIPVRFDAHARYDACFRTYEYWVGFQKSPFNRDFYIKMYKPIDFEAMNRVAKVLLEYVDFTCFSKLHTDVTHNNCRIKKAFWEQRGAYWVFTIQADRFLRNMVRAIVGTLVEVGWGRLDEAGFRRIIESKDRCKAGASMMAKGLFLTDIGYPEEIFLPEDGTADPEGKRRHYRKDECATGEMMDREIMTGELMDSEVLDED
jgi:tRNA pseudouridine38-40 synthase